jgi:hypothetical protein
MRQSNHPVAGLAKLVFTGVAFVVYQSFAADFSYANFDSKPGLILQGGAALFQNHLRLTPSKGGIGGGAWHDTKESIQNGFQTVFQLQITVKGYGGADGLAFVVQNNPTPALGYPGCNIGYGGISNLFVIKFGDYHFPGHAYQNTYGSYDEVAMLMPPSPATRLWDDDNNTIAAITNGVNFSDGQVHTVKIIYVPGHLQLFIDNLDNPLMTVSVNLASVINLDNGRAWVGFTAATGAGWQTHDLISWIFDSPEEAMQNETQVSPRTQIAGVIPQSTPVYSGQNTPVSPSTPLPPDPSFGYRLPENIGLTHQIETSTNLIDWTPLTNALYYFRDQDSTNYPERFYRFQKN